MFNSIIKPTIILTAVALISAWLLSLVNAVTAPRIEAQQKEKQKAALETVLPGYSITAEKKASSNGKELQYWEGTKTIDEKTVHTGYAYIASGQGYSGEIRTMVGVDDSGTIIAVSILQQTETPGLGARCQEVATKKTLIGTITGDNAGTESAVPWFQRQFAGLDLNMKIQVMKKGDWNESIKDELIRNNALSAITGATVTSRAVKDSIEAGMTLLRTAVTFAPRKEIAK